MKHNQHRVIFLYPFLFAIYPALALLAYNIEQVSFNVALRSLWICLIGSIVLYVLLWIWLKNTEKAALATLFIQILFFSYGRVYAYFEGWQIGTFTVGRHLFLTPIYLALFVVGMGWVLFKFKPNPVRVRAINLIVIALVAFPLVQMGWFYGRVAVMDLRVKNQAQVVQAGNEVATSGLPDVYWIILDGYTRDDVLQKTYGFDNSEFYNQLRQAGFTIPACAQSNYAWTELSLSSALQMDYIDKFSNIFRRGDQTRDHVSYRYYFQQNPVRTKLESLGYKTVAFETDFWWANINNADYYILENANPLEKYKQGYEINKFEDMFLRTTLLRVVGEGQIAYLNKILPQHIVSPDERHYNRILFDLEQIKLVPRIPGHKFVMMHLVAPHAPFVFSVDGKFQVNTEYVKGYPPEVAYLNKRIIETVRWIQENSSTPPVIIIQGDHGWDMETRMDILNAYYLPGGGNAQIYNGITPVNTFRVVLNQYFGMNYPILADISRFSTEKAVYDFNIVPNTCLDQTP